MNIKLRRVPVIAAGLGATVMAAYLAVIGGSALLDNLRTGQTEADVGGDGLYRRFADIYTYLSWAAVSLAAGISVVLMLWDRRPTERKRWLMYWVLLLTLLPISLANYWSGDFWVPRWQQLFLDVIIVVLGVGTASLLVRFRTNDVVVRAAWGVALFLLVMESVAVPGIYALLWLLNWNGAITRAHTEGFNPGWVSATASVCSLVVTAVTYRRTRVTLQPNSIAFTRPSAM